ncbi:helix-turn-helix transcriptional regulator [Raineyella sp. LH-20]|uniref:ArsR/SmtB family transcription factor n=1 Tax=Raineyella sp. LH-20 TaxID=3081204 RepID=UPI002953E94F|nr:helix-turn-helix transcriptional regulator [Raineyella sp. LH-20]WOP19022.1 helix-turn-helix transcriptional regulator [Raineyella sp. LH-20]
MTRPADGPLPVPMDDTDAWAARFDLLGDPTRLSLLAHMHLHPGCTVGELAAAAGTTPTTTSQALRVLRRQGWVGAERDGRSMRYTLLDDLAHRVLHLMGQRHAGQ